MVLSLTDVEEERGREREGGGKGGRERGKGIDLQKTSILALFYFFLESFILTILLFVESWLTLSLFLQSWKKLLSFVWNAYWVDETRKYKSTRQIMLLL